MTTTAKTISVRRRRISSSTTSGIILNVALIVMSLVMTFPMIWWVFATFTPVREIGTLNFIPINPTFDNFYLGWNMSARFSFAVFFRNSLFIGLMNVSGAVLTSGFVAYGFSRVEFKFRKFWFSILLMTLMLPGQVTIISQYLLYNNLNMIDTYFPLIMPNWFGGGAFFIFLVTQNIRSIPTELDEAAKIDGAGVFRIYWQIIFPLIRAPLTAVAIFVFVWTWDDFLTQLLYISSMHRFTVGLALRMFVDQTSVQWGELLAMALLSIVPSVILFFAAQKQFVEGIATTGIKG
jgi:multiple sugar transport system permease protein